MTGRLPTADAPAAQRRLCARLKRAGVTVNGGRPWDLQVHDERFFRRVLTSGTLGLGESYMDGWWDCAAIDQLVDRYFRSRIDRDGSRWINGVEWFDYLRSRFFNLQNRARARQVGQRHYDIGNDLYRAMLDPLMVYSCGYWKEADDLAAAQEAKLALAAVKLGLRPGMKLIDIGCGWGGMARFAAEHYGAEVTGLTISERQAELAREACRALNVDIRLQDFRELDEPCDRIVSIGMFEHVGYKNYRTFFEVARRCLPEDGLLLLHTIGGNEPVSYIDPWIDRYVFPNAMLPSASQLTAAYEGLFVLEDWQNFGPDYDRTLMAWHENFTAVWPRLSAAGRYDRRFRRMWEFYLKSCAGGFRARRHQLWQLVLSPRGTDGRYDSPR
ncbi:MAG: cyclopropane fatty acyl phospholipid synthase [Verrucomicrobiota bacterium]